MSVLGLELRVVPGSTGVVHLAERQEQLSAAVCHIRGSQLQLTERLQDVRDPRLCGRCARSRHRPRLSVQSVA